MEKLRAFYYYLKEKYLYISSRRYTTLAGTLVFFLITSLMPFLFWLTLLVGKLPVDTQTLLSLPFFKSVENALTYLKREAEQATAGASVLLGLTTLYSATNLFYQTRRSGEIIYGFERQRKGHGVRLRVGALVLFVLVLVIVILFLLTLALGGFLFSRLLSRAWLVALNSALLAIVAFVLVTLLNIYMCPYKAKIKDFLFGSTFTLLLWLFAVIGFSVYLKISNPDRLYGALSAVIVFLLWIYIMTICFIVGVILNSEKILSTRQKELQKRRRKYKEKKKE